MAQACFRANAPRACAGPLLHQLLRVAPSRPIHRGMARSGIPAGRAFHLPKALYLLAWLHTVPARKRLSAGEGQAEAARVRDRRRDRVDVQRQPPASDSKAAARVTAAAGDVLAPR